MPTVSPPEGGSVAARAARMASPLLALEVGLLRDVGVVPGDVELLAVDEAGGVGGDRGAGDVGVGVVAVADQREDEVFGDVAVVEFDGLGDRVVGGLPAGLVDAVHHLVHRARVVEEEGEERLLEAAALLFLAGHRGGVDGGGGAVGEGEGEAGEESELGDVAGPGGERTRTLHRATVSVAETGAVGYWARRTKWVTVTVTAGRAARMPMPRPTCSAADRISVASR
jgi:hypothetical protein